MPDRLISMLRDIMQLNKLNRKLHHMRMKLSDH